MNIPRNNRLMIEPPSVATGDIAFNLLIFFLVCASAAPDRGRRQEIPRAEKEKTQQENKRKNIEVVVSRTKVQVGEEGNPLDRATFEDGSVVLPAVGDLPERSETALSRTTRDKLRQELARRGLDAKKPPDQRIVVLRSDKDAPYYRWIQAATVIERAGGVVTLQMEESQEVMVK